MHPTVEEGKVEKSGCRTPDVGNMRMYGCPKSPIWEGEDVAWSEDESVSSSVSREDNVCNGALTSLGCMGLVTLSLLLEDL